MKQTRSILLVEDDAPQRKTLAGFLRKRGFNVHQAASAAEGVQLAAEQEVDLLLTDLRLGGPDGISLLASLKEHHPDLQALILTAYGTVDDAVRAMKAGAYDFLSKPVDLGRLEVLINKALERVQLARENRGLREVVKTAGAFSDLIGASQRMQKIQEMALKVAPSRASVLLLGESGTGKEVLARAIHRASPRQQKPFVVVNCGALPETLIESELFGYEKGAFTGASTSKAGRFELADGGTLFLDEVGDIPPPVQVKLLNVIQSRRFERVGGTETKEVDVRIIAATHRNLEERIAQDLFREDLYYRLNVVSITLPPLRERPEDVPLLVGHFLMKHADLASAPVTSASEEVLQHLMKWPFRGNVRQLENLVERAVVLADGPELSIDDFPQPQQGVEQPVVSEGGLEQQVADLEISLIKQALEQHDFNKSAAARSLEMSERAIRYKIKKYGL